MKEIEEGIGIISKYVNEIIPKDLIGIIEYVILKNDNIRYKIQLCKIKRNRVVMSRHSNYNLKYRSKKQIKRSVDIMVDKIRFAA